MSRFFRFVTTPTDSGGVADLSKPSCGESLPLAVKVCIPSCVQRVRSVLTAVVGDCRDAARFSAIADAFAFSVNFIKIFYIRAHLWYHIVIDR